MNNVKNSKKERIAIISVASNLALIIMKIIAGILSGSVSIISEAIHSSVDMVASLIALISVKLSSKPADKKHPYGHGKIENISGVIEGVLIFIAAYLIIKEAIDKILHPTDIDDTLIGIGVMIISAVVNAVVAKFQYKIARAEDSVALEADALHHKTDVYTSLGVGLGLLLIKLTGIDVLDPIVAILVALLIIKESWVLCRHALNPLLDMKLPDEEEGKIEEIMNCYKDEIIDYHMLKTRKSGHMKYIEFHMTVSAELTVRESHDLCERIEKALEEALANTSVSIHIEPGTPVESAITVGD